MFTSTGMSSHPIVTFSKIANARTGNILFQYLFCIRISLLYGHKYVAIEDLDVPNLTKTVPLFKLTDSNYRDLDENPDARRSVGFRSNAGVSSNSVPASRVQEEETRRSFDDSKIQTSHILCEGFFQRDEFYLPIRERLLEYLSTTDDSWIGFSGKREYIRDFMTSQHSTSITANDIVMSLRLDDFIQLPNPTSDILSPQYYMDVLEKWFSTSGREDGRLVVVSDKFRHHWEHKYIEHFAKWSPIIVQKTLLEDFALMRDCPALIHSNSSLCWFASFLSLVKVKHRYIPVTGTYSSQHLEAICLETDSVIHARPMDHAAIYALNVMCWHRDLKTMPYCVPDEVFYTDDNNEMSWLSVDSKKYVISPLIPGDTSNYLFGAGEETDYYNMYRQSMFALTSKKGGWDCLRHYEILAAGCIPIFENLDACPPDTLMSFPKELLREAYRCLLPWRNTDEQREAYPRFASQLFEQAKSACTASANATQFLRDMSHVGSCPRILMLVGHPGINYTRELNWIGIKRLVGTAAVEYPPLDFLYDDFPESRLGELYGNGFTYSRRLSSQLRTILTEDELVESIKQKRWDMIIYGKVGPDETAVGSVPNLPYWEHVFKRYSRDEIVFWYGGDGMQDLTYANRYSDHLVRNSQYARCFVRELIRWTGALV